METIHINLKEIYPDILHNDVYLDGLLYSFSYKMDKLRKAVLVLPGGGYVFVSDREKDPIMFAFAYQGFNAFSLTYSINTPYPIPYLEVMCAMHFINTHSDEFNIYKNDISLIGFSAGGHLAASYSYIYKLFDKYFDLSLIKPKALVLGYPVISLINSAHLNTANTITGGDNELLNLLSVEKHIDDSYPPTFVWTTKTDQIVNPIHTTMLEEQFKKNNVKYKCLIYSEGLHGLALANHATCGQDPRFLNKEVECWVNKASDFIFSL